MGLAEYMKSKGKSKKMMLGMLAENDDEGEESPAEAKKKKKAKMFKKALTEPDDN